MAVSLRRVTVADLDLLNAWDREDHVIASDPNNDWAWNADMIRPETGREYFMAEHNGHPIGVIELCDPAKEDSHYWGVDAPEHHRALDIWIGPKNALNQGFGTEMMHLALDYCFADPAVVAILIDPLASNERAHIFYERLGFRFVEYRTFDTSFCKVYKLTRQDWEVRKRGN